MNVNFKAKPPKAVELGSLFNHLLLAAKRFVVIISQALVPFTPRPQAIDPFPEQIPEVTAEQLQQCQWMFDQAEERRIQLEQKAQATFGVMIFLVPLLASVFVFLSKGISEATADKTVRSTSVLLLILAAFFLLLAFISVVRAISVKEIQTLFLDAVLREDGHFRQYNRSFHSQGLLYCASMNTATNDHIAQFVRGGHILSAAAVILLLIAAIPAGLFFSRQPTSLPTQVQLLDPVHVESSELTALRTEVANLRKEFGSNRSFNDRLAALETRVERINKAGVPPKSFILAFRNYLFHSRLL